VKRWRAPGISVFLSEINLFESVAAKSHQIGNGERGKEN
jgi:hypothetical protein